MNSFRIKFVNNQKITINDVINLTSKQKNTLLSFAKDKKQEELKLQKEGLKIELTGHQRKSVIKNKDRIIKNKTINELYNSSIVLFNEHFTLRLFERFGSQPSNTYTSIISDIIKADDTYKYAEWKGYPRFSYTLNIKKSVRKSIILSFINNNQKINLITITNYENSHMDHRITEDQELSKALRDFKERLESRLNE